MKRKILLLTICLSIFLTACQSNTELNSQVVISSSTDTSSSSENTSSQTNSSSESASSSESSSSSSSSESASSSESSSSSTSSESTSSSESSSSSSSSSNIIYSGPSAISPDAIYTGEGYQIGNHFIEYANRIYNNDTIYQDDVRMNMLYFGGEKPTYKPSVMWYAPRKTSSKTYDIPATIAWARANWDKVKYICAPFVTKCFEAGGLAIGSDSSTMLCLQLLNSGLGFGEFITINSDQTVTLPEYARPGDIVQSFCPYEGLMLHSMLYVGNDENGHMRVICRNPQNGGNYAYKIDKECYDDLNDLKEVFFFHFFHDDDDTSKYPEAVQKDSNILLYRKNTWKLDEVFDRAKAVEYAKTHIADGIGSYGAQHLSSCLTTGGISVSFPNNTSLLFQLLTSGLGSAHTVNINNDRTVTLPQYVKEGDVVFLSCPEEGGILGSFVVKGADKNGKMILYTKDSENDETKAYHVDENCLSCSKGMNEVIFFCFD